MNHLSWYDLGEWEWDQFLLAQAPGSTMHALYSGDTKSAAYGIIGAGAGAGVVLSTALVVGSEAAVGGMSGFLMTNRLYSLPTVPIALGVVQTATAFADEDIEGHIGSQIAVPLVDAWWNRYVIPNSTKRQYGLFEYES